MNPDQKFIDFLEKWADEQDCIFEIETFDGRESEDLIDGMAVDDVWGWKIPKGENKSDNHYGCAEWNIANGKLVIAWKTYS